MKRNSSVSRVITIGLFAAIVLGLLGFFILRIERLDLFSKRGPTVDALFDSVAGLNDRSSIRIAGVRIGVIDGIELDGRKARVHLVLDENVILTEGTSARLATVGLLGESYVELLPGPDGAPRLAEGATIPGETPMGLDQALAKLGDVADSIAGVAEPLAGGLSGRDQDSPIGSMLANLQAASAQLRLLIENNDAQLNHTIRNFETFSTSLAEQLPSVMEGLDRLVQDIQGVVAENRGQISASSENIASLTAKLDSAATDLGIISERLAKGEGSIGKLLTSDEAHDQLVDTLASVEAGVGELSNTLGRVQKLKLDLDLGGFYLSDPKESHGTFGLTLSPDETSNRLYRVALVETPRGDQSTKTERITITEPDGTTSTRTIETLTINDESVFNALLGLRFDNDSRVWAGLIESHFGVQGQMPLFNDRLWLDLEAFDFDRDNDLAPHLRLTARYWLNENIFIQGGYDDPLENQLDSIFIGGGIKWNDDTLKYLLGSLPLGSL